MAYPAADAQASAALLRRTAAAPDANRDGTGQASATRPQSANPSGISWPSKPEPPR
jgi:hypothetical protein